MSLLIRIYSVSTGICFCLPGWKGKALQRIAVDKILKYFVFLFQRKLGLTSHVNDMLDSSHEISSLVSQRNNGNIWECHLRQVWMALLTLSTLGKIFQQMTFCNIYFFVSQETGFDISYSLSSVETSCMKCLILFPGKNKKNIISVSPVKFAQRVIKIKAYMMKFIP